MMVLFFCIALKQWQSTYRSCCHYVTSVNRNHPKQAAFSISLLSAKTLKSTNSPPEGLKWDSGLVL